MEARHNAATLVDDSIRFAEADLPETLKAFPRRFMARMEEIEVPVARREEWNALLSRPA